MARRTKTWTITAATLSLLLVSACGGGTGEGSGGTGSSQPPPSSGGVTEPPPPPSPTSMSVKEYGAALVKAMTPLSASLDKLSTFQGYKGLEKRVTDVETTALDASSALSTLNAPPELLQPNTQLSAALAAFGDQAANKGSEVADRALCTGALTRLSLGNASQTTNLRKAVDAVYDLVPGNEPAIKLPKADLKNDTRPKSGTYLRDVNRNARAQLKIENGGSTDAVVTLTKGKKPDISVFLRKGADYTVRGVPDGTYSVFFRNGSSWDEDARAFGRNCRYQKFADPLKFRTIRDSGGIRWQNWTITLNPVVGGNAPSEDVDPEDFPDE